MTDLDNKGIPIETVQRIVLLVVTSGSFLTSFMVSALNIALPSIQKDFAADAVLLSWVATSYILATAVFLVPIGKIADIHGRNRIYKWGFVIFTLLSFSSGLVPSI